MTAFPTPGISLPEPYPLARGGEQVWGGLGGPKEKHMKAYAVIWTFGLIVAALTIRVVLEVAIALQGRSWS